MRLRIAPEPFDPGAEANAFTARQSGAGAIVTFTGLVRDEGGRLTGLEIEHYTGMTERAINAILEQAMSRWQLADAMVIHRFGSVPVGAPIMMVATAAQSRAAAFSAADFLMDFLKSRAPFWKKELGPGAAGWVLAKDSDEAALTRWDQPLP